MTDALPYALPAAAGLLALLMAGLALGASATVVLAAGGWYARRRWLG